MRMPLMCAFLLFIAVCVRLTYIMVLPVGQTVSHRLEGLNDEPAHIKYVTYLMDNKRFPVQTHHAHEPGAFIQNEFEYYQAPVYYVIGAAVGFAAGKKNIVMACRLVSFIFGVLAVFVVWRISSALSASVHARTAVLLFSAFLPAHAYFSSVVSNDSLCWLVCALIMWALIRQGKDFEGMGRRWPVAAAVTGALMGIGMLVKASIVVMIPVVILFYLMQYNKSGRRSWLLAILLCLFVCFGIAGAWYVRNELLYGSLFAESVGNGPHQFFLLRKGEFTRFLYLGLFSFWFPMQHIPQSHAAGAIVRVELLYTGIGAFLSGAYYLKRGRKGIAETTLAVLLFVNIIAYVKYNLYWSNADGRFLLPSFAGISILFCVPLTAACRRFHFEALGPYIAGGCAIFPYTLLVLVP